ncbi:hypothetical protein D9615_001231 [Tricholomella constricta]|uniref:Uncharacterized protein n=1 Tax=Tricholomella constricta TaxID=117010 RepID=A0A8H5M8Z0_9AGAR|nr:hypothetical protein D9615_001231 [Tricholomella constricta]
MPANDAKSKPTGNPIANRTLAQSYAALPARTRLYFSLGVCAVALAGIMISDQLEEKIPAKPSDNQKAAQ